VRRGGVWHPALNRLRAAPRSPSQVGNARVYNPHSLREFLSAVLPPLVLLDSSVRGGSRRQDGGLIPIRALGRIHQRAGLSHPLPSTTRALGLPASVPTPVAKQTGYTLLLSWISWHVSRKTGTKKSPTSPAGALEAFEVALHSREPRRPMKTKGSGTWSVYANLVGNCWCGIMRLRRDVKKMRAKCEAWATRLGED
jgi:hypothetical protein